MHFGPRRAAGEPDSAFYLRMAKYCACWALGSAPTLFLIIHALRQGLGGGPLWMGTIFAMLLAGFALGMSVVAGVGFFVGAGWAHLCEASPALDSGWKRFRFALATLVILPVWIFAGYQVLHAILWQEIITTNRRTGSRWAAFQNEPVLFLFALSIFTICLVALPPLWMQTARVLFGRRTRSGGALATVPAELRDSHRLPERRDVPGIGKDV